MIEYKDIYDYLDQVAKCDEIPTLAGWVHWRKYATVIRSGSCWQLDPSDIAVEITVTTPGAGLNVTTIGGGVKTIPQYVENTYYADDVWAVFPAPHIVGGISVLPPTSTRPLLGMATWIVNLEDAPLAAGWGAKAFLHDPIIPTMGEWVTFDRTAVKVKMMSRNAEDSDAISICERAWNSNRTGVGIQTAILEAAAFNGVQLSAVPKGAAVPSLTPSGGNASTGASGGTYTLTTPSGTGTYTFGGKSVTSVVPGRDVDEDAVDDGPTGPNQIKRKQVIVRLEEDLRDRLSAVAKAQGRSVNYVISEMIRREIEDRAAWKEDQFIVSWQLLPDEDTEVKQEQIKKGIVDLISAYGGKGVYIRNRFIPGPATHGQTGPLPLSFGGTMWLQLHNGPPGKHGNNNVLPVHRMECETQAAASNGAITLVPRTAWKAFHHSCVITHWSLWTESEGGQLLFTDNFIHQSTVMGGDTFSVDSFTIDTSPF